MDDVLSQGNEHISRLTGFSIDLTPQDYEKQIYDLRQLLELSRSLCSTLELKNLIETILFTTMAQTRVSGAGIFVLESYESTRYVLGDNYTGLEPDTSIIYQFTNESQLIQTLALDPRVYTIQEMKEKVTSKKELRMLDSLSASLIVPLAQRNHVNGVLILGTPLIPDMEYSDYEKEELIVIASLASIAVNNASLIEQSSTDMMTKLKLKHYFFNILDKKMDSAIKLGQPLAVVMFDIDFFKKFNDDYGHMCGDYVLASVAAIIKKSIRDEDMTARYGGEEFVVMLNNTSVKDALRVADRIRKNIEKTDFFYQGQHMKVHISGGVSILSKDTNLVTTPKALIDQADKALYISKKNGRNRITYADPALIEASNIPIN